MTGKKERVPDFTDEDFAEQESGTKQYQKYRAIDRAGNKCLIEFFEDGRLTMCDEYGEILTLHWTE